MSLTLMYITNNTQIAQIAEEAGVDRIWIDMEYIGKGLRQGGMDTVQNHHTIEDIKKLRSVVNKSELLVRINPIHEKTAEYFSSEEEIEETIQAGADVIMLPYFKKPEEVRRFVECVKGRAKTLILIETTEAVACLDDILKIPGIDEAHVGLNDLHLAMHQTFMFELLCDGTVDKICEKLKAAGIKYGFGGIARVGFGMLPAEYVITEHYKLGSTAAILSRGFCDANRAPNPADIREEFINGVMNIRKKEEEVRTYSDERFAENHLHVSEIVGQIVSEKKKKENEINHV